MHTNPIWTDCLNKAIEKHQKLTVKYERKDEKKEGHLTDITIATPATRKSQCGIKIDKKNILQSFYLNIFIVIIYEIY